MTRALLWTTLALTLAAGPLAAARPVTLSTRALTAVFQDGTLVGLRNALTGEQYFAPATGAGGQVALAGREVPLPAVRVKSSRTLPGGHRWIAVTAGEHPATITTTVLLDEAGGFTVQQQVSRPQGGIAGVEWGWQGLALDRCRLVIPAAGGVVVDPVRTANPLHFEWPGSWQAAALFVQGKRGGCWLWTDDPARHFKDLHYRLAGGRADLRFATQSDGAPERQTAFTSVTWRVAAYRGDWHGPAARYRDLMARSYGLRTLARRSPSWAERIALVVRSGALPGPADLARLAEQIPPDRVLFYLPDWRTFGYDVNYPEYTPRPEIVEWTRAARARGFHVMIHCNWAGVNPRHPLRAEYDQYLLRDRWSGEPVGWYLDRPHDPDHQIMVLNTAFPQVRRLLVSRIGDAVRATGADAVHLDFPVLINGTHPRVQGRNALGGAEEYLRDLQAALPGVAIGTEGIHEVLLGCSFAQLGEIFWNPSERLGTYHPVRAFLFSAYCHLYGHLGMPDAATSLAANLDAVLVGLRLASLPTLSVYGNPIPWEAQGVDLAVALGRAWAEGGLHPDFALRSGEAMAWQGGGKRLALTKGESGWTLQGAGAPLFTVVEGSNTGPAGWGISGWPAQDEGGAYGLDPARRYLARPQAGSPPPVTLARPTGPVVLTQSCQGEQRASFDLAVPVNSLWSAQAAMGQAKAQVLSRGRLLPLAGGACFQPAAATCMGVRREGIFAHPPWQGEVAGGATVGEFRLAVPRAPRLLLRFATGLADIEHNPEADPGDGATFAISVNGTRLFRRHHPRGTGWQEGELDFTSYAGKTVTLRLITEPGPAGNITCDWAYWSGVRLEAESRSLLPDCTLVSDRPAAATVPAATVSGEGPYRYQFPGGAPTMQVALLYQCSPVTLPANLADLPYTTAAVAGGLGADMSVYGSGTRGTVEMQGVSLTGINAHTPSQGQTQLDWGLTLPAAPCRLHFRYGVREGGESVHFAVVVNGETLWSAAMPKPAGWQEAAVDLSRWAGQTILLRLVTDSDGPNNCDWAWWGEPMLEEAP